MFSELRLQSTACSSVFLSGSAMFCRDLKKINISDRGVEDHKEYIFIFMI